MVIGPGAPLPMQILMNMRATAGYLLADSCRLPCATACKPETSCVSSRCIPSNFRFHQTINQGKREAG